MGSDRSCLCLPLSAAEAEVDEALPPVTESRLKLRLRRRWRRFSFWLARSIRLATPLAEMAIPSSSVPSVELWLEALPGESGPAVAACETVWILDLSSWCCQRLVWRTDSGA
jgi:hypothetical protein